MVIKASASAEIRQLTAALDGDDDVRREAAIARLAIIGARAVDALCRTYSATTDRNTRIAVLRALEPLGDRRTIAVAREAIAEGGDVARAAASALRGLLDSLHPPTAADALDVLVAMALDRSAERRVRLAAVDALQGMPEGVRARITEALQADPDPGLLARADGLPRDVAAADAVWQDALDGRLPDTPATLRDAAQGRAGAAALGSLQKMIDLIRSHEATVENALKRNEWRLVRGTLHQALALRGSRVAVYDLREALHDSDGPLPTSFLAALHVVGDQTCLEPLAGAYAVSNADARTKVQLAAAYRAIARREKVTRRHPIAKRISARWAEASQELMARA
jgi:HEAT repeat protein